MKALRKFVNERKFVNDVRWHAIYCDRKGWTFQISQLRMMTGNEKF